MTVPRYTGAVALPLPRDARWVVHHLMLDALGLASAEADPVENPPESILSVLEKLESGEQYFTPFELDNVRYACKAYTLDADAPRDDRDCAQAVVRRIDEVLADVPRTPSSL